jgi:vitamin B12 transporter
MKRFLVATVSFFALFASNRSFADAAAPTPDVAGRGSVELDEVVVSATRSPQPLARIGSSITILSARDIEDRQVVAVSDLLGQTPGVGVSRNGGIGGTTALRIRGAETDQTLVVIDGVKLNDPSSTGGGYNFGNLLTGDIARIEVLRGAQSTLWGSQAIGGVVNIVTAQPTTALEVSAELEGGSRGTAYANLAAGGTSERIVWRIAGSRFITDGHSAYVSGAEKDGYQNSGLVGRLRLALSDSVSVDLRSVYSRGHSQFDGFPAPLFAFADTAEYAKTREFVGYAGLNFDLLDGRLKNRAAYAYTDTNRDSYNPDQAVTPLTFDAVGANARFEYQGSFSVMEGWDTTFGAEHEKSSFRTASPSAFAPNPIPSTAEAAITGIYGQLQAEIAAGLTLTAGLRYDDHETFGDRALGQAALAYALNEGDTILRASFGQGFKAPTLYQLYSVYGNLALNPEEADSWDAGIEQRFFENALTLSATGFYRKTQNQIDFVSCPNAHPLCTPGRFGVYDNTARSRAKGIEIAGKADLGPVGITANYTLTDTENTSPGNVNRGKALARRPKHAANFSANYKWPFDISTGINLRYVGDAFDNAANNFVLEDYTLVDFLASWQVNKIVEIYGRVENVFDEVYAITRNYGNARRGVFAGVRTKF